MKYDVRQRTVYDYAAPVSYARHVLRLTPIDRPFQRVESTEVEVSPLPVARHQGVDFFGNVVTSIAFDDPHETLTIEVSALIEVNHGPAIDSASTPAWHLVREAAYASADFSASGPAQYLFPSRQVSLDPEIESYAAESFPPKRTVLGGAVDFMARIKREFTYEPGVTTATTTAPMSFALRRGVCQDFTHIMISGMRSLGIPVAYVSGYLRTVQASSEPRLEGADAMHAWAMVWCGEQAGWVGLDPTNNMLAGDDHVVLAIGRDYADVAPIDGVVFASGAQRLKTSVQVIPIG